MLDKEQLFREILKNNKDRMYRMCCYYVSGYDDRQDLYQEILIKIWNSIEKFRGDSNINTYIYRIAINTSLKFVISSSKKSKKENELSPNLNPPDQSDGNDNKVQLEKDINKLLSSINQLAPNDKTIISLLLEKFSYQQIADITGLERNYIGVKINRIKLVLKKLMEES